MKILHLLYEFKSGGAERFVADLANAQMAQGHDVTVCIIRPATDSRCFCKRYLADGVKFESLGIESGISLGKVCSVSRYISAENPVILHCHHNVIPYVSAFIFKAHKGTKIVHTVHSDAHRANASGVERRFCRIVYKLGLVHPVTISKACRESFSDVYSMDAVCIENGRSAELPSCEFEAVRSEIDTLKPTPSTRVLIHVGRCHPIKNQMALVEAVGALVSKGEDVILLMIGSGFDSELGMKIRSVACKRIFFLGEKSNVADYLHCSDIFCLPSLSEGLSISLVEALSCGVLPVCTAVGGNPDVVADGITGLLSFDTDADSYCKALQRALVTDIDRQSLVEYYESRFGMDACQKRYMEFYESLAHNN